MAGNLEPRDAGCRPFIHWRGNKEKLQHMIRTVFPRDISRYAEHFGGSGAILLGGRRTRGVLEVYNDFDSDLANTFSCVKLRPLRLIDEMKLFPMMNEAEFKLLKEVLNRGTDLPDFTEDELSVAKRWFTGAKYQEIEQILRGRAGLWDVRRAAAFCTVNLCSFSSSMQSYAVAPVNLSGFFDRLKAASVRLDGVPVTNRDCVESIRLNNGIRTLHYCDPPYYEAESSYRTTFGAGNHSRLHDAVMDGTGYFVISYNYCDPICELYSDCYILYFARKDTLSRKPGAEYEELVITRFDPVPVMDANLEQLTMFTSPEQEQGDLLLVHKPGQSLTEIGEIIAEWKDRHCPICKEREDNSVENRNAPLSV